MAAERAGESVQDRHNFLRVIRVVCLTRRFFDVGKTGSRGLQDTHNNIHADMQGDKGARGQGDKGTRRRENCSLLIVNLTFDI
jgi:hypothetical protein